ncbi:ABC transporter ATP-binding protein [Thermodesulfobacteriota bacterium]
MSEYAVEIKGLNKTFSVKEGTFIKKSTLKALVDVDLKIKIGEVLGLVGESGCGKSTLAKCMLRLIEPDSGEIFCAGEEILALDDESLRKKRRDMQIIFQDPASSLNPYMKVVDLVGEGYKIHGICKNKKEIRERVKELIIKCGLNEEMLDKRPHEFSGGQRQRISIARALCLNPKLIICDEPVSALDVSIQAQIINLLIDLQKEFDLTYLFISHDLKLVEHIADNIVVMYLGRIVEKKRADDIRSAPQHPYTKVLLSSILEVDSDASDEIVLEGDIPSPIHPPAGCVFHTRCYMKKEKCEHEIPKLREIGNEHYAACHFL